MFADRKTRADRIWLMVVVAALMALNGLALSAWQAARHPAGPVKPPPPPRVNGVSVGQVKDGASLLLVLSALRARAGPGDFGLGELAAGLAASQTVPDGLICGQGLCHEFGQRIEVTGQGTRATIVYRQLPESGCWTYLELASRMAQVPHLGLKAVSVDGRPIALPASGFAMARACGAQADISFVVAAVPQAMAADPQAASMSVRRPVPGGPKPPTAGFGAERMMANLQLRRLAQHMRALGAVRDGDHGEGDLTRLVDPPRAPDMTDIRCDTGLCHAMGGRISIEGRGHAGFDISLHDIPRQACFELVHAAADQQGLAGLRINGEAMVLPARAMGFPGQCRHRNILTWQFD